MHAVKVPNHFPEKCLILHRNHQVPKQLPKWQHPQHRGRNQFSVPSALLSTLPARRLSVPVTSCRSVRLQVCSISFLFNPSHLKSFPGWNFYLSLYIPHCWGLMPYFGITVNKYLLDPWWMIPLLSLWKQNKWNTIFFWGTSTCMLV